MHPPFSKGKGCCHTLCTMFSLYKISASIFMAGICFLAFSFIMSDFCQHICFKTHFFCQKTLYGFHCAPLTHIIYPHSLTHKGRRGKVSFHSQKFFAGKSNKGNAQLFCQSQKPWFFLFHINACKCGNGLFVNVIFLQAAKCCFFHG